jgi:hypothetical protein
MRVLACALVLLCAKVGSNGLGRGLHARVDALHGYLGEHHLSYNQQQRLWDQR